MGAPLRYNFKQAPHINHPVNTFLEDEDEEAEESPCQCG